MKTALTAVCVLLLLAVGYLSLSLVVLNPPRANFSAWFALAGILIAQTVLTLIALTRPQPPAALRQVVVGGALALAAIAVWRVRATLTGAHFEGYNLVLGALLFVQAALTVGLWGRAASTRGLTP
jgi:hypothetical protein